MFSNQTSNSYDVVRPTFSPLPLLFCRKLQPLTFTCAGIYWLSWGWKSLRWWSMQDLGSTPNSLIVTREVSFFVKKRGRADRGITTIKIARTHQVLCSRRFLNGVVCGRCGTGRWYEGGKNVLILSAAPDDKWYWRDKGTNWITPAGLMPIWCFVKALNGGDLYKGWYTFP